MGIADKIRDAAEDIKDKATGALSDAKHKAQGATSDAKDDVDNGNAPEQGFGEPGREAASSVDPGPPPGRTPETRHPTVQSDKIQGL